MSDYLDKSTRSEADARADVERTRGILGIFRNGPCVLVTVGTPELHHTVCLTPTDAYESAAKMKGFADEILGVKG